MARVKKIEIINLKWTEQGGGARVASGRSYTTNRAQAKTENFTVIAECDRFFDYKAYAYSNDMTKTLSDSFQKIDVSCCESWGDVMNAVESWVLEEEKKIRVRKDTRTRVKGKYGYKIPK